MTRTIATCPIRPGKTTFTFTTEGQRRGETPNVAKAPTRIHFLYIECYNLVLPSRLRPCWLCWYKNRAILFGVKSPGNHYKMGHNYCRKCHWDAGSFFRLRKAPKQPIWSSLRRQHDALPLSFLMSENNEIFFRDTKQIKENIKYQNHKIIECCYQLLRALILYSLCHFYGIF